MSISLGLLSVSLSLPSGTWQSCSFIALVVKGERTPCSDSLYTSVHLKLKNKNADNVSLSFGGSGSGWDGSICADEQWGEAAGRGHRAARVPWGCRPGNV